MALTSQSETILLTMLSAISPADRDTLGSESTQDLAAGVASLVTAQRGQSMSMAITAIVTGAVSNWTTLNTLAEIADGATVYDTLAAFTSAKEAQQASAMLAHAVAHALASKKRLGV